MKLIVVLHHNGTISEQDRWTAGARARDGDEGCFPRGGFQSFLRVKFEAGVLWCQQKIGRGSERHLSFFDQGSATVFIHDISLLGSDRIGSDRIRQLYIMAIYIDI
jgi:hypothetical protein